MPAIPPTPEAVRAAMAPPRNAKHNRRAAWAMIVLAIATIVAAILLPRSGERSPDPTENPPPDGEIVTRIHPEGFRILVTLDATRSGRRAIEFETTLEFAYLVRSEDEQAARDSIRTHWSATGARITEILRTRSKLDLTSRLDEIGDEVIVAMDETMFPGGVAEIDGLRWAQFTFR